MPLQNLKNADGREWPQMAADDARHELNRLTGIIIGAGQKVSRAMGAGFLEKVYENALSFEVRTAGLQVEQQHPIHVFYGPQLVGVYTADLLVEGKVLVELKAQKCLEEIHRLQCTHYLRATNLRVCLLMNFGRPRMEVWRVVNRF